MEYLHSSCQPPVVHRSLNSACVVVSDPATAAASVEGSAAEEFRVAISDAGLALLNPIPADALHTDSQSLSSTSPSAGAAVSSLLSSPPSSALALSWREAYMAPEVRSSGVHSLKADCFSLGVVLLELLCGRTARSFAKEAAGPSGGYFRSLVEWGMAQLRESSGLEGVVDPCLLWEEEGEKSEGQNLLDSETWMKSVQQFADVTLQCLQARPESRPTMAEVVVALQTCLQKLQTRNM